MSDIQNLINQTLNLGAQVGSTLLRQDATKQLTTAQRQTSATHFDFFSSLSADPLVDGYADRMAAELHSDYTLIAESITNPFAKKDYQQYVEGQKEADRQRMLGLQSRNTLLFGGQELLTSLDKVLASGVTPGDDLDTYRMKSLTQIGTLIGSNRASGIIDDDRAAQLSREYTQEFNFGFSRDLALESARMLLEGNTPATDTLDLLTRAIRAEGADLDAILAEAGVTVATQEELDAEPGVMRGPKVISEAAALRIGDLAAAYRNVDLTPDDEEKLVTALRTEVREMDTLFGEQKEERATVNDLELHKLVATGDAGMQKIGADDFAILDDMYGDDDESKGKWVTLFGTWDAKRTKEAEAREAQETTRKSLQEYDVRIEGVRESAELQGLPEIRADLLADDTLTDDKRNGMLGKLTAMENAVNGGDEEDLAYDALIGNYDIAIAGLGDAVRKGEGDETAILAQRDRILRHPDMRKKAHEEDKAERVNILEGFLDDIGKAPSKTVAQAEADTAIWEAFSNTDLTPNQVLDVMRTYEANGTLPVKDSIAWTKRIREEREELNANIPATSARKSIDVALNGAIRSTSTTPVERALLTQERATAAIMFDKFLNDPKIRAMSPAQQKEEYDGLLSVVLAPSVARATYARGDGTGATTIDYEEFKAATPAVARTMAEELQQEWVAGFQLEFADQPFIEGVGAGGGGMSTKTEIDEDGENIFILRHNASGVQFTKRRKVGAEFVESIAPGVADRLGFEAEAWWVRFPGESDWQKWNDDSADRMENL